MRCALAGCPKKVNYEYRLFPSQQKKTKVRKEYAFFFFGNHFHILLQVFLVLWWWFLMLAIIGFIRVLYRMIQCKSVKNISRIRFLLKILQFQIFPSPLPLDKHENEQIFQKVIKSCQN